MAVSEWFDPLFPTQLSNFLISIFFKSVVNEGKNGGRGVYN